ncbi:hypothetical protein ABZ348_15120 [Streptomyces sp. NPDC005963]|uniref:hypothetical protein n=1 Tax=Streptomyces sp. NPDC005963 TaxID=3156721 RepID=UPI0033E71E09
MRISVSAGSTVETAGHPLAFSPRFDFFGLQVIVAGYGSPAERERQLPHTFGSMQWLASESEHFRFDHDSQELCSATFFVPPVSAPAGALRHTRDWPTPLRSGLRADPPGDFDLTQASVFSYTTGTDELRSFRDTTLLATTPDARIEIAPYVCLLVQGGTVAGWSLTDPARYLTDGFAEPENEPPSPTTRTLLADCLDLVSSPLVEDVMDKEPDAWLRLRTTERALREQPDDRGRANILHRVISRLIEDYASW